MNDLQELQKQACEVRDAQQELENTARRVGLLFLNIINAYQNSIAPATTATNGYMTAAHAAALEKVSQFVSTTAGPKFEEINSSIAANTSAISAQATQLQSFNKSLSEQSKTVGSQAAKISELEKHNVPATAQREGYMTPQMVFDLESTKLASDQLANSTLTAETDYYDYSIVLTLGQFGSKRLPLPVHGGDDGETPAGTPALIDPEAFLNLSEFGKHIHEYAEWLNYIPYEVDHVVKNVEVKMMSSLLNGLLVYNESSGKFLWQVTTESGLKEYFDSAKYDSRVGQFPQAGRLFFTKVEKRVFLGVSNGASEFLLSNSD